MVPCEKPRIASMVSSVMKNIIFVPPPLSKFPMTFIYCVVFECELIPGCLLKSTTISLQFALKHVQRAASCIIICAASN